MQTKKRIILGSASPRRRELLEQIGISFEVRVSDKEEVYHSLIPEEIVKELALSKAENVADDLREKQEQVKQISFDKKNNVLLDTIVIGADTIVVSDGSILGKPNPAPRGWCRSAWRSSGSGRRARCGRASGTDPHLRR